MQKKSSILRDKSFQFAVRIVKLAQFLQGKKECIISEQILKSGTSVGASVREAEYAQSNADFIHKYSVALKEINETAFWLKLLHATDYIGTDLYESMDADCNELIAMLVSTIKTLKS
jgi:four helix bundle protein